MPSSSLQEEGFRWCKRNILKFDMKWLGARDLLVWLLVLFGGQMILLLASSLLFNSEVLDGRGLRSLGIELNVFFALAAFILAPLLESFLICLMARCFSSLKLDERLTVFLVAGLFSFGHDGFVWFRYVSLMFAGAVYAVFYLYYRNQGRSFFEAWWSMSVLHFLNNLLAVGPSFL